MYVGDLSHKPYFIVLMLQDQLIVRPTKNLVISHMVEDLVLLN